MLVYKDGTKDERDFIGGNYDMWGNIIVYATTDNGETFEKVQIGTLEAYDSDPCSPIVGENPEKLIDHFGDNKNDNDLLHTKLLAWANRQRLGHQGYEAHVGDTVEVVKGRKYTKGTRFVVTGKSQFTPEGTYGHGTTYYLNFNGGRINEMNVKIVEVNEKSPL